MVQQARRRNRAAIDSGRVTLDRSTAEAIPWPDATFTGAVAVNSMQLWDPLDAAVHELARVLAPSGWFVAITHVWAIERQSALEDWTNNVSEILTRAGFGDVSHRSASFRSGEGLVLRAQKRLRCNRKAP